ncbi:sugar ABC transporter permease [Hungatella hathewayi]|uniref:Sugar ABC transporter permease n=1 Tax=Hungatella hathewayi TaxID=154046 RepID=A0A3E2WW34_9FIRM|nr:MULTISPECIES: sugar ABC transporter permease [Clostridia]MEE0202063.1 sugar ABC transporter permease [Muricomes sp.]MRM90746.1 sugar ABC transporter permease [Faecalicatena contorta]RGC32046.1 sugar ABC transporter permease [Hungatella hathewayi]
MHPKRHLPRKRTMIFPYLVIAPAIILILIFKLYPIVLNIWSSFQGNDGFSTGNYARIFGDRNFWNSILTTFKFCIILIPVQIVISFGMALLVSQRLRGIGAFRTIYYLPVTVSITVACIMWNMMLNPTNGVVNSILMKLGMEPQQFFTSNKQALASIMMLCIWKGCGYLMMFLLAGIKDIDETVYESAKIDGASYWQSVFHIMLPMLKRTMAFVVINDTTSNLLLFAPMYMITKGGPQNSTNVLMYEVYKSAFIYGDSARAAASMSVLLLIVGIIVAVQFKFLNKEE